MCSWSVWALQSDMSSYPGAVTPLYSLLLNSDMFLRQLALGGFIQLLGGTIANFGSHSWGAIMGWQREELVETWMKCHKVESLGVWGKWRQGVMVESLKGSSYQREASLLQKVTRTLIYVWSVWHQMDQSWSSVPGRSMTLSAAREKKNLNPIFCACK